MQSEPQGASSLVWALPRSLAATYGITFVFSSSGYLDVSVHRVPGLNLWIQLRSTRVFLVRLPHSDICGSWSICLSPQLFAAYHVFHRLLVPRHPPCALHNLTCYAGISPDLSIIWILFLSFSQRYELDKAHFFRNGLDEFLHLFWCLDFGLDIEHIFDLLDLDIIYISVFGFQGTITLFMIFDHDLSLTVWTVIRNRKTFVFWSLIIIQTFL